MTANVWYCGKCRKVLRCQPRHAIVKGCACKVPHLPKFPTKVSW